MSSKISYYDLDAMAEKEHQRHIATINKIMGKALVLKLKGKISAYEYNQLAERLNYNELHKIEQQQYVDNVLYYRYGLIDIYSKVIDAYSKYQTGFSKQEFPDLMPEMEEFLKFIGCYSLYKRIKDRSMIINTPNTSLNICINGGRTSYIVLKKPFVNQHKPKSFTIVHEMGHAYYYHLIADFNESVFARHINSEIPSLFFERLYLDFLRRNTDNKELVQIITKNFETQSLTLTKGAKHTLEMFDNPKSQFTITGAKVTYTEKGEQKNTDLYQQTYAMGNIGATRLFCDYEQDPELFIRYLPDFIKSIHTLDFATTLLEYSDIEPLEKCLENNLTLKLTRKDT